MSCWRCNGGYIGPRPPGPSAMADSCRRCNGGYLGPRPAGPSAATASGLWDLRSQFQAKRDGKWPVVSDPFWASTELVLNMDGTNGSTTFVDDSSSGLTITAVGDAQITTSVQKFGTGSLTSGADSLGTTNYLSVPGATLGMGSGDFTLEVFYLRTAAPSNHVRVIFPANHVSGSSRLSFLVLSSGQLYADIFGTVLVQSSVLTWNTNQWYHIAITRDGSTMRLWRDGTQVASATRTTTLDSDTSMRVVCGSSTQHLDAIRVTRAARYTANFTPPTVPHPVG